MLFSLAVTPVVIFLVYIYIKDKYEKEPIGMLWRSLALGALSTLPVILAGGLLNGLKPSGKLMGMLYSSFVLSAGIEELGKFIMLYRLIWKNKNFNEPFDGIVYGVFISLGFALVENIMYVFNPETGGIKTALLRAVASVPGHGLFGISMGYYMGFAKFEGKDRVWLLPTFFAPWILHGIYNFILFAGREWYIIIFILFLLFMWRNGFRKMEKHLEASPFKNE